MYEYDPLYTYKPGQQCLHKVINNPMQEFEVNGIKIIVINSCIWIDDKLLNSEEAYQLVEIITKNIKK